MDNAKIKCGAEECKYHAGEDKCTATSIRVNNNASQSDALCTTYEKKDCCCK